MSDQPKPHHCKIDYNPDTDQVIFTVTENANQPKPTTGEIGAKIDASVLATKHITPKPIKPTGEWTTEGVAIWNDTQPIGVARSAMEAKQIADAHNAALAAEHLKAAQQERFKWEANKRADALEELLAAERKKA